MRNALASVALFVLGFSTSSTIAAAPPPAQAIGRVTAAFGAARADTAVSTRPLDIQSLINNDERIITDGGGITVLLASRVVLKVDVHTAVSVFEGNGQTTVRVQYGTVHVYVGQRPDSTGPVCVQDPNGCMQTATGVLLLHYDPTVRESYFACEHSSATAQACSEQKGVTLSADKQAIARDGKFVSIGDLDREEFNHYKLSLDRLGQAQSTQGAQTFRLRSRAFDMESAISQLSAAGWIDPHALPTATVATTSNNSSSNSNGNSSIGEVTTGKPHGPHTSSLTPAPVATPVASSSSNNTLTISSSPQGAAPAQTSAPIATPTPIDISSSPTPSAPAPIVSSPAPVQVSAPVAASTPIVTPTDIGLNPPNNSGPGSQSSHGNGFAFGSNNNSGPGNLKVDNGPMTTATPPAVQMPAIDLGGSKDGPSAKPSISLPVAIAPPSAPVASVAPITIAPVAPIADISSPTIAPAPIAPPAAPIAPPTPIAVAPPVIAPPVAPPVVDLGLTPISSVSNSAVASINLPKVDGPAVSAALPSVSDVVKVATPVVASNSGPGNVSSGSNSNSSSGSSSNGPPVAAPTPVVSVPVVAPVAPVVAPIAPPVAPVIAPPVAVAPPVVAPPVAPVVAPPAPVVAPPVAIAPPAPVIAPPVAIAPPTVAVAPPTVTNVLPTPDSVGTSVSTATPPIPAVVTDSSGKGSGDSKTTAKGDGK
jgi:hypothetical protein